MLERDLEEEAREAEEEARQATAAQADAQPHAPALPPSEQLPAAYIVVASNTSFTWVGPVPTLIDLTHPEDNDDA